VFDEKGSVCGQCNLNWMVGGSGGGANANIPLLPVPLVPVPLVASYEMDFLIMK
jgi:hypothetical protein